MPRNSEGIYTTPPDTEAVSGEIASASAFNTLIDDIETALTYSLTRDGSAAWSGDQNANGFVLENLSDPINGNEAATKSYVDNVGWSAKLGAINDLTWVAFTFPVFTGPDSLVTAPISNFSASMMPHGNAADWRTALEIDAFDIYTGGDVNNTTFPIGTVLNVDPGASTPGRNASLSITLKAGSDAFEIAGAGSALTGTWRARGLIGGSLLVQRTA